MNLELLKSLLPQTWEIPIFPEGSLDASVTTTVWVGVLILSALNLRLGWTYSGLVVPGYLVPLMIAKPWAAVVIVVEAVLTYLLTYILSEKVANRTMIWCNFFGRDRFFMMVLLSVVVRLVGEVYVLPSLGRWITEDLGYTFDYHSNLHSFGLIIVALLANQLWKPGLLQGLHNFGITLGLTYGAIKWLLIPLTNFKVGGIDYMYEDIASSFLASPKSYLIMLTTGFVASQMNLRYGWDFNGILVPSLLSLMVFQPMKIVTTFVEAWAIFWIAQWVMSTPWLRETSIENARKMALFFNVSFGYKIVVGWAIALWFPEMKITDWYGFGYLLPTLLAIRMHDKSMAVRLSGVTLVVTSLSGVIGGLLGFSLTLAAWNAGTRLLTARDVEWQRQSSQELLVDRLRGDRVRLYGSKVSNSFRQPSPTELETFRDALRAVDAYMAERQPADLDVATDQLSSLGMTVELLEDERYLYVREKALGEAHPRRRPNGWGIYVFHLEAANRLALEVPEALESPRAEASTIGPVPEAAGVLLAELNAYALAIGGTPLDSNQNGSSNLLVNPDTFFHEFHRIIGQRNFLQVRAYTGDVLQALGEPSGGVDASADVVDAEEPPSSLWLKGLPRGLNTALLARLVGQDLAFKTDFSPIDSRQRAETREGFVELYLNRADLRHIQTFAMRRQDDSLSRFAASPREVDLSAWLLERGGEISARGSGRFQEITDEELIYLDDEVLRPILATAWGQGLDDDGRPRDETRPELDDATRAAALFGYRLQWLRDPAAGDPAAGDPAAGDPAAGLEVLALVEDADSPRRWGTYLFRLDKSAPFAVQVPRPLAERATFEYGVELFAKADAGYFLLAGAHPLARSGRRADPTEAAGRRSLFNLVHQGLARTHQRLVREQRRSGEIDRGALPDRLVAVQVRGFTPPAGQPAADVFFSLAGGFVPLPPNAPPADHASIRSLETILRGQGQSVLRVDGTHPATAGYEASGLFHAYYLEATEQELAVVWLSSRARSSYRQQRFSSVEEAQLVTLGIPHLETRLDELVSGSARPPAIARLDALAGLVERYLRERDVVVLRRIQLQWPRLALSRVVDPETGQAYLVVRADDLPVLLGLLQEVEPGTALDVVRAAEVSPAALADFRDARRHLLLFGAPTQEDVP